MAAMTLEDIIVRAQRCCERVPVRENSQGTKAAYWKQFERLIREENLDPFKKGIARDTYNFRRAALHTGSRMLLEAMIAKLMAAGDRRDAAAAKRIAGHLLDAVTKIEKALDLDPPLAAGASSFDCPASRWRDIEGSDRERGKNSKKHELGALPVDWDQAVWTKAREGFAYLDPLAVQMIAGVRPEELVQGPRPAGWSEGVIVTLRTPRVLAITFAPAKSHNGLFGTELTTICVDPLVAGDPSAYLADRCRATPGQFIVVCIGSKDAMRKAIGRLGCNALPNLDVVITPYTIRHQRLADLKFTFGGGEIVATAAGHSTDRTQADYGATQHGRKLAGYISISATRPPNCKNVERARRLGERKIQRDEVDRKN
jgi:hypothetical protein